MFSVSASGDLLTREEAMNQINPPGSSITGHESAANRLKREADAARTTASTAARDIEEGAQSLAEEARIRAGETVEQQKGAVSSLIGDIAEAVNSAAGELGSRDHSAAAQYANSIGSGLRSISQTLDRKSVGEMVSDVTEFARRNPAAYIGGSLLIGIALARFAVASPPSRPEPRSNPDRGPTNEVPL
jgi:hypothetical protein